MRAKVEDIQRLADAKSLGNSTVFPVEDITEQLEAIEASLRWVGR